LFCVAALIRSIAGSKKEKLIKNHVAGLERSIAELERAVRAQDLKAAFAGSKYIEKLHVERGSVYKQMIDVASLRSVADNSSFQSELCGHITILADRIDKLLATAR
jgi:hypothetical protein